jgi:hypothetical protein
MIMKMYKLAAGRHPAYYPVLGMKLDARGNRLSQRQASIALGAGIVVPESGAGATAAADPEGSARVHEYAKQLGIPSRSALRALKKLGVKAKSHSSTIHARDAERLRIYLAEGSGNEGE